MNVEAQVIRSMFTSMARGMRVGERYPITVLENLLPSIYTGLGVRIATAVGKPIYMDEWLPGIFQVLRDVADGQSLFDEWTIKNTMGDFWLEVLKEHEPRPVSSSSEFQEGCFRKTS
jgi:hypothetical protein